MAAYAGLDTAEAAALVGWDTEVFGDTGERSINISVAGISRKEKPLYVVGCWGDL